MLARQLAERCRHEGIRVIFSGLREQPREVLRQMSLEPDGEHLQFADDFPHTLRLASAAA
jgi:SulP family sulfate permease